MDLILISVTKYNKNIVKYYLHVYTHMWSKINIFKRKKIDFTDKTEKKIVGSTQSRYGPPLVWSSLRFLWHQKPCSKLTFQTCEKVPDIRIYFWHIGNDYNERESLKWEPNLSLWQCSECYGDWNRNRDQIGPIKQQCDRRSAVTDLGVISSCLHITMNFYFYDTSVFG